MPRKSHSRFNSASSSSSTGAASSSPHSSSSTLSSSSSSSSPSLRSSQNALLAPSLPPRPSLPSIASASALTTASQRMKMPLSYLLPGSKAEPVSGVTKTRSHGISASSSANTSAISALQQPSSRLLSSSSSPSLLASFSSSASVSASPSSIIPHQSQSQPHYSSSPLHNGMRPDPSPGHRSLPTAILCLAPINGTFERKQITVPYGPDVLRIGRQTNPKTVSTPSNGYFDSKVLSRQHAEIWAGPDGRIFIKDIKSSNGTFVNGHRLSPENQESEPHELRDNDSLELGIDIVSEDQKSIVHHKVSARVEYAGPSGPSMNVMEMSFGDIDPTGNGGLYPQHLAQPLQHMRSRSNSNSSVSSNRTVQGNAGSNISALQHQRHMNYWLSPISIEQVVKRLSSEMREAKLQSQELSQTQEFITSLLSMPELKKPAPENSSLNTNHSNADVNNDNNNKNNNNNNNNSTNSPRSQPSHSSKVTSKINRLADAPPAPPPSQPLPEKPRISRSGTSDSPVTQFPPFAGPSGREIANSISSNDNYNNDTSDISLHNLALSAARNDSDMFATLIESLSNAKRELDVQGARVKELEALFQQERSARKLAEEKVRKLEELQRIAAEAVNSSNNGESGDSEADANTASPKEDDKQMHDKSPSVSEAENTASLQEQHELKKRLDSLLSEMDDMRQKMAQYKETAEKAEADADESRKALANMVETMRREREEAQLAKAAADRNIADETISPPSVPPESDDTKQEEQPRESLEQQPRASGDVSNEKDSSEVRSSSQPETCPIPTTTSAKLHTETRDPARPTAFSTKQQFSLPSVEETTPYTSMMGVVLIGVGIMAYLNGWGRVDK